MSDIAEKIKGEHPNEFIEDMQDRARKIKALANKIARACDQIDDVIYEKEIENQAKNHLSADHAHAAAANIEQLWLTIRGDASDLLEVFSRPNVYDGLLAFNEAISSKEQKDLHTVTSVKSKLVDDVLFIKMPPLPSMYHAKFCGKNSFRNHPSAKWFLYELEASLLQIPEQPPLSKKHHFAYLHIIKTRQDFIPDNDNRDTKYITDTVCNYLYCSDSATTCSFSSTAAYSKELDEGSYLMVSTQFENPPSLEALIRAFINADLSR